MATKTITEALQAAITAHGQNAFGPELNPARDIKEDLRKELRDFFAHEVLRFEASLINDRGYSEADKELLILGARALFSRTFSQIPGMKTGGEK